MSLVKQNKLHQTARKIARRAALKIMPKGVILMYHRIGEPEIDPWSLHVSPQNFQEQMEVLQKYTKPMRLKELAQRHKQGNMSDRSVAVTFDDGYADNLYLGKPILERYQIPATFFIATGHINKTVNFWWDGLRQLLLQPGQLPAILTIQVAGKTYSWELGTAVDYTETDFQRDKYQDAWESQPGTRMNFYFRVWQVIKTFSEPEIILAMQQIQAWVGREVIEIRSDRSLTSQEILTLANGELTDIGAHTVNHPSLDHHSSKLQFDEIHQSKLALEQLLNRQVDTFAYPYGCFTDETVTIAEKIGLQCACSTNPDVVWSRSSTYKLPRYHMHNWNGQEFAAQLEKWFQGLS